MLNFLPTVRTLSFNLMRAGFRRQFSRRSHWLERTGMTATMSLLLSVHAGFLCDSPLIAQTNRSDYLIVKDRYSNYDYGYSVRIPKGLTALRSPAPFPNHGFVIHFSDDPNASLSVDASYNAADWTSFDDAINAHRDSFKREVGGDVSVVAQVPTALGELRAKRFTMKPNAPDSKQVREVLLAFRNTRGEVGIVYEIVLTTLTSRYNRDKHAISDLLRTWSLKSLPK